MKKLKAFVKYLSLPFVFFFAQPIIATDSIALPPDRCYRLGVVLKNEILRKNKVVSIQPLSFYWLTDSKIGHLYFEYESKNLKIDSITIIYQSEKSKNILSERSYMVKYSLSTEMYQILEFQHYKFVQNDHEMPGNQYYILKSKQQPICYEMQKHTYPTDETPSDV